MKAYFCLLDDSCHIFSLSCKISLSIYQKIIIMIKKFVSSYDILDYLESLLTSTNIKYLTSQYNVLTSTLFSDVSTCQMLGRFLKKLCRHFRS